MEWSGLVGAAAELFLGARCAGCDAPGLSPCPACRRAVLGAGLVAAEPVAGVGVIAAGEYDGVLRRLIVAGKERGALLVLPLLADRLAAAVAAVLLANEVGGTVLLVPVPSTPSAVVARGLDFTGELTRQAARRLRSLGVPARSRPLLGQLRTPADQAGLGLLARRANLAGAFTVRGPAPASGTVVVTDDVVTTGSSLAEAVRALRVAGIRATGAATVAATMRNGGAR